MNLIDSEELTRAQAEDLLQFFVPVYVAMLHTDIQDFVKEISNYTSTQSVHVRANVILIHKGSEFLQLTFSDITEEERWSECATEN